MVRLPSAPRQITPNTTMNTEKTNAPKTAINKGYSPGINYNGDRPNLYWPAFLCRLQPALEFPRIRRTIRPNR